MQTQDIVETWRQEAIQEGVKQGILQGVQQGILQGVQQGILQGVQQGVQQGIQQGECAVLLRLLRQRFGAAVDAHVEQRIATAPVEQIDLWTMRILSATALAEVFAE